MKPTSSSGKLASLVLAASITFSACGNEIKEEWCTWGEHIGERLCCAIVPSQTRNAAADLFSSSRDLTGEAGESLTIVCDTDENWPCAWGQYFCGNKCVDFETDDDHCGKCDNPCGIHSDCISGACACVTGFRECDGVCVDTNNNPAHCGSCDLSCGAGESCIGGTCQ